MAKSTDDAKDAEPVLTPGGPRAGSLVHQVHRDDAVQFGGAQPVLRTKLVPRTVAGAEALRTRGLVLTPGGFRRPSDVYEIDSSEKLRVGRGVVGIHSLQGAKLREVAEPRTLDEGPLPALGSGWIAYAAWTNTTGSPIQTFRTEWVVPPEPRTKGSQTIFLFNGIDPTNPSDAILQPVLQWGPSAAGGGQYWSVASWYVTGAGAAFHSNLIRVNPGDVLTGLMTLTSNAGGVFDYTSEFVGIANSSLTVLDVNELVWANQTLEAYSVAQCSEYPQTDRTVFSAIAITTAGGSPSTTWTPTSSVTDCGQRAAIEGIDVAIYYRDQHELVSLNQAAWVAGSSIYRYGHRSIPNISITGAPADVDPARWAMLHDGSTYRLYCFKAGTNDRIYQFGFNGTSYAFGHNSIPVLNLVGFPADADATSFAMLHDGAAYRLYLRKSGNPQTLYQAAWVPGTTTYQYGHNSIPEIPVTGFPADSDFSRWGMLHDNAAYRLYVFQQGSRTRFRQGSFNATARAYEFGYNSIPELTVEGMPATSDVRSFAMLHDNVDYRFYFQTW